MNIMAQNTSSSKDVYSGIEFKMNKINEPVIPNNTVNIIDFGAVNGGSVLCTKAFADPLMQFPKRRRKSNYSSGNLAYRSYYRITCTKRSIS